MYAHFSWHFYQFLGFSIEMVVTAWKSSEIASSDKFAEKIQTCFGQVGCSLIQTLPPKCNECLAKNMRSQKNPPNIQCNYQEKEEWDSIYRQTLTNFWQRIGDRKKTDVFSEILTKMRNEILFMEKHHIMYLIVTNH